MDTPAEPPAKKATVTQVMEWLTACKRVEQLHVAYEKACTHEWSDDDAKTISECYENVKRRIESTPAPALAA